MTRTVKAGEFKAKCLRLLDEVAASGDSLVITKRGKPIAELRPLSGRHRGSLIGGLKGMITSMGDVVSPIDVEWEALRD